MTKGLIVRVLCSNTLQARKAALKTLDVAALLLEKVLFKGVPTLLAQAALANDRVQVRLLVNQQLSLLTSLLRSLRAHSVWAD